MRADGVALYGDGVRLHQEAELAAAAVQYAGITPSRRGNKRGPTDQSPGVPGATPGTGRRGNGDATRCDVNALNFCQSLVGSGRGLLTLQVRSKLVMKTKLWQSLFSEEIGSSRLPSNSAEHCCFAYCNKHVDDAYISPSIRQSPVRSFISFLNVETARISPTAHCRLISVT